MPKVLIVDDHESMRDALKQTLLQINGFETVAGISSAKSAFFYCSKLKPDLIFMDICTKNNFSGIDAVFQIKSEFPDIKIIIMTAFEDVSYIPRAKSAGADGFVYKKKSLAYFAKIAVDVLNGDKIFPKQKTIPVSKGEPPLTDRELDILRLMCKNMTNQEIGKELFISENTVKYHKTNILAKTGFSKSMDLVFHVISKGWINPIM